MRFSYSFFLQSTAANGAELLPKIVTIGSFVFVLLAFVFVFFIVYSRQKQNRLYLKEQNLVQQHEIALAQNIIKTQEDERKRLAQNLHDDVGATLSALHLHISNLPDSLLSGSHELNQFYERSLKLAAKAAKDVRDVSHNLLPKDFSELGLFRVVQNRIDEINFTNTVWFDFIGVGDEARIENTKCITVYRIVNELISNIVKHSQARKAVVQILISEEDVELIAEDDGIGMNTAASHYGIGMKNIQSRIDYLKGDMRIDSSEKGTVIIINLGLLG